MSKEITIGKGGPFTHIFGYHLYSGRWAEGGGGMGLHLLPLPQVPCHSPCPSVGQRDGAAAGRERRVCDGGDVMMMSMAWLARVR